MKANTFLSIGLGLAVGLSACTGEKKTNNADSLATDSSAMNHAMSTTNDTTSYMEAHASLTGTKSDTTVTGMAHFSKKQSTVTLALTLHVPKKANSTVAVHFHEHGDCGDAGNGAHGHWNPTGENHGEWKSSQFHSGDIGNIKLDKDGKATVNIETDRWTIGGPQNSNILNKALIVHSGVDDYKTQPTGNSGSRIGCGVINKM